MNKGKEMRGRRKAVERKRGREGNWASSRGSRCSGKKGVEKGAR